MSSMSYRKEQQSSPSQEHSPMQPSLPEASNQFWQQQIGNESPRQENLISMMFYQPMQADDASGTFTISNGGELLVCQRTQFLNLPRLCTRRMDGRLNNNTFLDSLHPIPNKNEEVAVAGSSIAISPDKSAIVAILLENALDLSSDLIPSNGEDNGVKSSHTT